MLFFLWPQILTKFTTQESYTFDSHDMIYSSKLYMRAFQKHLLLFQNETRLYCLKKIEQAVFTRICYAIYRYTL